MCITPLPIDKLLNLVDTQGTRNLEVLDLDRNLLIKVEVFPGGNLGLEVLT